MTRATFASGQFLKAARQLAAANGPAAVTVDAVTRRLKAPTGSFYHRFRSRDLLLGELWLAAVLDYQHGFFAALAAADGLAAALHMPAWARAHLDDACLLLLYSRHDFVQGEWPQPLKQGVADQARRFEQGLKKFARDVLGGADAKRLRLAQFMLVDVPGGAVRPHLRRREKPPPIVDGFIRTAYRALVADPPIRRT